MKFHAAAVLTVVGEKLLPEPGARYPIDPIYKILNYMLSDKLFTHQLPRAREQARPEILRQHPQLADYDDSECTTENHREFLAKQVEKYGEWFELEPLAQPEHQDPLQELVSMVGPEKVVVVKA